MIKRLLAVVLVVAVIAGAYWLYTRQTARPEARVPEGIRTEMVTRGAIDAIVSATGNVTAERTQSVAARSSGVALEVLAVEGQPVTAGQVLARLDPG